MPNSRQQQKRLQQIKTNKIFGKKWFFMPRDMICKSVENIFKAIDSFCLYFLSKNDNHKNRNMVEASL